MFTCDFLASYDGMLRIIKWKDRETAPDPDLGLYIPILDLAHANACLTMVNNGQKAVAVLAAAVVAMALRNLRGE